jgi:hypothetical protein
VRDAKVKITCWFKYLTQECYEAGREVLIEVETGKVVHMKGMNFLHASPPEELHCRTDGSSAGGSDDGLCREVDY